MRNFYQCHCYVHVSRQPRSLPQNAVSVPIYGMYAENNTAAMMQKESLYICYVSMHVFRKSMYAFRKSIPVSSKFIPMCVT